MSATAEITREPLKKKDLAADHPTWCPGCGDFSVLALYFKLIQNRGIHQEKIATVAGIGCSSRFPYFVQSHGVHFIHGRALPFATGVAMTRPDLDLFVFGGDGDCNCGLSVVRLAASYRSPCGNRSDTGDALAACPRDWRRAQERELFLPVRASL